MKRTRLIFHLFVSLAALQPVLAQHPVESFVKRNVESQGQGLTKKDGFGAEMLLVNDRKFFAHTTVPNELPPRVTEVRHKGEFLIAILIQDPGSDADGKSMVTYDLKIVQPDGKTYYDETDVPAWKKETPPLGILEYASGVPSITIDNWDPPGRYQVKVVVHDRIRNIDIPLEAAFTVDETPVNPPDSGGSGLPEIPKAK